MANTKLLKKLQEISPQIKIPYILAHLLLILDKLQKELTPAWETITTGYGILPGVPVLDLNKDRAPPVSGDHSTEAEIIVIQGCS